MGDVYRSSFGRDIRLDRMAGGSPLARLVNSRLADDEVRRARLKARFLEGFMIRHTVMSEVRGRRVVIDGREVLNFASASYLGFDQHPAVLGAAAAATQLWGQDAGHARVDTTHEVLLRLEDELARLVGADSALVFSDAGQVHQAVLPTLLGAPGCRLLVDRGVPQSLFQAVQAAKGRGSSVAICDARDPERVRKELASAPAGHRALLVSSIDPATGESTNLKVLEEICRSTGAILYLDDSHGLGVRGEHGGGACEEWGLEFENLILVSSLHNGLGSFGAFVAGRTEWIDLLRLTAKSYLHSSSVPPQVAESARVAIRLCLREEGRLRRERLTALSRRLASELDALGFTVRSREGGPLLVVQVSGEVKAILSSRFLFDRQIFVSAVLSPAIPRGEAALRIAITALHTDAEASQLLLAFADLMTYWRRYRSLLGPNLEFGREFVTRQVAAPLRRAIQDFSPHHGLIPRDQTT